MHAAVLPHRQGDVLRRIRQRQGAVTTARTSATSPRGSSPAWCGTRPSRPAHGDENFFHPDASEATTGRSFDFFCGGDSFLADGRMLSAGGTLAYPGHISRAAPTLSCSTPPPSSGRAPPTMAHGRWYPTLIDARRRPGAGRQRPERGTATSTTRWRSTHRRPNAWQALHLPPDFPGLPLYAHLFLMADGGSSVHRRAGRWTDRSTSGRASSTSPTARSASPPCRGCTMPDPATSPPACCCRPPRTRRP